MSTPVYGQDTIPIGGGEVAKIGGMIYVNTTAVGTTAVTTEENLMLYTLPANTLLRDGQGVRIIAWGTNAANANTGIGRLLFGGTLIKSNQKGNNTDWVLTAEVTKTGVSTQKSIAQIFRDTVVNDAANVSLTKTDTAGIVIKVTGQNDVAAANDIVCEGMRIEFLNAE